LHSFPSTFSLCPRNSIFLGRHLGTEHGWLALGRGGQSWTCHWQPRSHSTTPLTQAKIKRKEGREHLFSYPASYHQGRSRDGMSLGFLHMADSQSSSGEAGELFELHMNDGWGLVDLSGGEIASHGRIHF
jgi:hypothetical protein